MRNNELLENAKSLRKNMTKQEYHFAEGEISPSTVGNITLPKKKAPFLRELFSFIIGKTIFS